MRAFRGHLLRQRVSVLLWIKRKETVNFNNLSNHHCRRHHHHHYCLHLSTHTVCVCVISVREKNKNQIKWGQANKLIDCRSNGKIVAARGGLAQFTYSGRFLVVSEFLYTTSSASLGHCFFWTSLHRLHLYLTSAAKVNHSRGNQARRLGALHISPKRS